MDNILTKNKKSITVVSVILFIASFFVCAYFGWRDVLNYLFSPSGENVGEVFKMPPTYTVVCFIFLAILIGVAVLGYVLKSKVLVLISAAYELLFIVAFIMLAVFVSMLESGEASETVMSILEYLLAFVLIPVYGSIWTINRLFFLVFIPLVVFNIVAIVRAFKIKK